MRRYQCSRCSKRVHREAVRCVACGGEPIPVGRKLGRAGTGVLVTAAGLALVIAVSFSDRYVPAVADWYTRAVINYVPDGALWLASPGDDDRAFYVCARSVIKEINNDASVVTFASLAAGQTRQLDDGSYLVESYVDEAIEDGPTYRRTFSCTLRESNGEWQLEAVEVEQVAATPVAVAAAR
jgi:hypothetical protein